MDEDRVNRHTPAKGEPRNPGVPGEQAFSLIESALGEDPDDLAAWKIINSNVCRQCHLVGGNEIQGDPKQVVRGPNLERVNRRLRPDWVKLWISSPPWITPYTSMPVNFPADKKNMADLFGGDGWDQIDAAVFGLFNYQQLLEAHGKLQYVDPAAAAAAAAAANATPPAKPEGTN